MNGKAFLNVFWSSELINTSETVSTLVDLRKNQEKILQIWLMYKLEINILILTKYAAYNNDNNYSY